MAKQFNVAEDMAYTCESAGYFWLLHVLSRWERFQSEAQRLRTAECIKVSSTSCNNALVIARLAP